MYYPQWKRVNNPIEKVSALLESLWKLADGEKICFLIYFYFYAYYSSFYIASEM